ncbi:hypothetical protein AMS68_007584 [Peltaster fructicola]|uniref:PHD-type domain-containing protein n=1 Tax=Peltaster fructicola TaxID=286661 RepID=A0A6H0Y4V0_9PEZI|nr:hypothetical protein AMS68_007584 [Peltaster fructicola]
MPRYKRSAAEAELDMSAFEESEQKDDAQTEMLTKLRNMWEFASLMQYIYLFGSVVKIDEDLDIEDLEKECLQTTPSDVLAAIGLALLKYVSSHRGLTPSIFSEYTRRQYLAKLPSQNPFGDEEEPIPFNDLDVFARIRVLQQLSTWTLGNAERIRGLMTEGEDELNWRMEPLGWDADDRAYFVLDDNRLYRRTDEPPPPPTPQTKTKSKPASKKKKPAPKPSRGTRTSKRRKIDETSEPEEEQEVDESMDTEDVIMANGADHAEHNVEELGYGFTSKTWECLAITLAEYQEFLATIQRSRDANEKALRRRIEEEVRPIIEKRAEAIKQKQLKKLREIENVQKMATAKRSSRLADKADKQAKEEEERQVELRKAAELRMAHDEQDRARRLEEGHESRRLTREQRLKEREVKRILHEEELARLEREASTAGSQQDGRDQSEIERKRLSSRNLQNQQEAHRKELERLTQDQAEDKWYFDCIVCGMHGDNLDDGSHSVACERCNVWQHSNCHGFTPEQCENENFHFICGSCRKKENTHKEHKSGIVLKLGKQNGSPSLQANGTVSVKKEHALPDFVQRQLDAPSQQQVSQAPHHPQQRQEAYLPQPNLTPAVAKPPMYQPPVQHIQQMSPYQPGGFASTPPQRTQGPPTANIGHPMPGMAQHNWVHYNAVNGSMPRPHNPMPPAQPTMYTGIPMTGQPPHAPYNVQRPPSRETAPMSTPQQVQLSPVLATINRSASSVQHTPGPQPAQGILQSSPHTSFPPPNTAYNRQAAVSPIKSSPPRPTAPSPSANLLNGHAGSFSTTNSHAVSPAASFENAPKLATPSKTIDVSVSPANNTSELATNGMKGPWPHGSLGVPHKHDASAGAHPQ